MKTFLEALYAELEDESIGTRKMLALVPTDKGDWRPHAKSMTLKELGEHVADLPTWVTLAFTTDELDFVVNPYNPQECNGGEELVAYFDKNLAEAKSHFAKNNDEILDETWSLKNGDEIYMQITKYETIRHSFGQIIHHRAQLGVYLRLLNIPIPGVYGPSADEMGL